MGGFKRKTYKLIFADEEFAGLEVRTRGATIDDAVKFRRLLSLGSALLDIDNTLDRDDLYESLHAKLISWNRVDDDDTPVPLTVEALRAEDWDLVIAIAKAWLNATMGVSRPLAASLPSGGPSLEASIPMESPSENLTSSPTPS